ncbi:hypothetical protein Glove_1g43 [Diversispora epigaea]|uniref:Uncharacterized protein n=1 Tax=Diversispora epigaea TaxID=1348612 RepID=A0A397JTI0_9GLOM|nr:hypothetical protein Glove_1g43 [Diversispora epigaea]
MPSKLITMCYVHNCTEKITPEFIIREITAISKVSATDPTKIMYLRIKVFVPINPEVNTSIEEVENGDVIHLVGKISIMATRTTVQTVQTENNYSILEFEIEEYLG